MEKKISYLNKTFDDYKKALIAFSEKYYPDLSTSFEDASVASWIIDLMAAVADSESYHLDRAYQETNVDSANEIGSLMSIARNNGVRVPGPKGSMAEVKISVVLSAGGDGPNWGQSPIIKRGTRFAAGSQEFELLSDVDFNEQFDEDGNSNRTISPTYNTNGVIIGYLVSKLAVVTAGESRVFQYTVTEGDAKPFMEIILPVENVMGVESIIEEEGTSNISPSYGTFFSDGCDKMIRYYEVENLAQSQIWTDKIDENGQPVKYKYTDGEDNTSYCITKGEWKPTDKKFITEYTDNGYLKITFGGGDGNVDTEGMTSFAKSQISYILNTNALGVYPGVGHTIYVLYRVGGGKVSNVAKGAINRISYLNAEFRGDSSAASTIMKTLKVENTTPSVSGKDMPTAKELKYLIKYHTAAQNRCVTVKDYSDRIMLLPAKYGTPFRVGVMEENNKIMVYLLGINHNGQLDTALPLTLVKNIENYLSAYRMINDYVEIKNGRIVNLSFEVNVIMDKNYNRSDVVTEIINTVENYMDINNHFMGEEIYVGDLEKEISKIDGVINLIGLKVFNEIGTDYSTTPINQEIIEANSDDSESSSTEDSKLVDLEATDGILYTDGDTMMEIKYPEKDIRVRIKEK